MTKITIKFLLIFLCFVNIGCISTIHLHEDLNFKTQRNFGYTKIIGSNNKTGNIGVFLKITSLGLAVNEGLTFGYEKKTKLDVPLNCHVIFLIDYEVQIFELMEKIPEIQKEEICLVRQNY